MGEGLTCMRREHRPSDRKKATQDVDDEVAALDELDSRIAK